MKSSVRGSQNLLHNVLFFNVVLNHTNRIHGVEALLPVIDHSCNRVSIFSGLVQEFLNFAYEVFLIKFNNEDCPSAKNSGLRIARSRP